MTAEQQLSQASFLTHGFAGEVVSVSMRTTTAEMGAREANKRELHRLVTEHVTRMYQEGGVRSMAATYEEIFQQCLIAPGTMKKVIIGQHRISRDFLYKFAVGFHMSREEADAYFSLCGGFLSETNDYDYVVLNALRDKDSADSLIGEFLTYFDKKL
jgi:hypothetical protein